MSSAFIDSDDEEPRSSSCASFWGPFRPLFGGHTLREAATSAIFPTILCLIWRFIFAIFLFATLITYTINDEYNFEFYSIWCHLGLSLAFFGTSTASALYLFSKPSRTNNFSLFASFVIPFFQVFATAALFLDLVFWALLFDFDRTPRLSELTQHALNLVFVLLDIVLSLRMQFGVFYSAVFIIYTIAYLIFAWIRFAITDDWVYKFLNYQKQSAGITVAYYFGIFAWAVVASAIMISLSRLSRLPWVKSREKSRRADGSVDAGESVRV